VIAPVVIHADELPAQSWRNGGGRTRELLTRPAGERAWRLRISLAEVDRNGPFSAFADVERWFSVIDGAGVRLSLDGRELPLRPGHAPIHFSGELPVFCSLLDGPTTDLNLMHAGGRAAMARAHSGVSWSSPLTQRGLFTRAPGRWQVAEQPPVALAAHCLLWLDRATDAAWTFVADHPSAIAPGLWLGFEP
jgi:environmental stress-induced protein Ves